MSAPGSKADFSGMSAIVVKRTFGENLMSAKCPIATRALQQTILQSIILRRTGLLGQTIYHIGAGQTGHYRGHTNRVINVQALA